MSMTIIYALADPLTREVLYVGQCINLKGRYSTHLASIHRLNQPLYVRLRSRLPDPPVLIVLEKLRNKTIKHPKASTTARFGTLTLASVAEAKWLKRFRRTVLNINRKQCLAYDDFVNTPELRAKYDLD